MDRRLFLKAGAIVPATAALPELAFAQQLPFNPRRAEAWRAFEVTTRVEILFPEGVASSFTVSQRSRLSMAFFKSSVPMPRP